MMIKNVSNSSGNLLKIKSCTHNPVEPLPNALSGSLQNTCSIEYILRLWINCGSVRINPNHENIDRDKFHNDCYKCIDWYMIHNTLRALQHLLLKFQTMMINHRWFPYHYIPPIPRLGWIHFWFSPNNQNHIQKNSCNWQPWWCSHPISSSATIIFYLPSCNELHYLYYFEHRKSKKWVKDRKFYSLMFNHLLTLHIMA